MSEWAVALFVVGYPGIGAGVAAVFVDEVGLDGLSFWAGFFWPVTVVAYITYRLIRRVVPE